MKRNLITMALLTMTTLAACNNATANDLFSKKKDGLSSAFGTKPSSPNRSGDSRMYSTQELHNYVQKKQFAKASKIGEGVYKFDYKYEKWTFPAVLSTSKDGSRIWVTFNLKSIEKNMRPSDYSGALLRLLETNGKYGEMFFRYAPKSRLISCSNMVQVKGQVADAEIDSMILKLAKFASGTSNMWDTRTWSDAPKHVGTWSSEQMQLSLGKDGSFQLQSPSNTSRGSYNIDAGRISLVDSGGERIDGNIKFEGPNQFTLNVNDNRIKFVRK